jgi:hypothetical protein
MQNESTNNTGNLQDTEFGEEGMSSSVQQTAEAATNAGMPVSGEPFQTGNGVAGTANTEGNGGGSLQAAQQQLLAASPPAFANETYQQPGMDGNRFNNDPSRSNNEESDKSQGRYGMVVDEKAAPLGWDEPVSAKGLNYNYNETVKEPSNPLQYFNQDGTLDVPHPNATQMQKEWDTRYPKVNGIPVVGVKKNSRGDITEFKLATGQLMTYAEMLRPDVELQGMIIGANRQQEAIIRSAPDGFRSNNLDQLPEYQ